MEIELVHEFSQLDLPFLHVFDVIAIKLFGLILRTHELDSEGSSEYFLLSFGFGAHDLKNRIKSYDESFASLAVFSVVVEHAFGSKYKDDGLSIVGL